MRVTIRVLLVFLLVSLTGPGAAAQTARDVEKIDCDSTTAGWKVADPRGSGLGKTELTIAREKPFVHDGKGALRFFYEIQDRKFAVLLRPVRMAGLRSLSFWIRSENETVLMLMLREHGGASFTRTVPVAAGEWKRVELKPDDFGPAPDSPSKRESPDPAQLLPNFILMDQAPARPDHPDSNTLWLDTLRIERGSLARLKGITVAAGQEKSVTKSSLVEGDITVEKGGTLKVSAPRLVVEGSVNVNGGLFEVRKTSVTSAEKHRIQFKWIARDGGAIELHDTTLSTFFPMHLEANRSSRLVLSGVQMEGAGLHVEVK
ncbi:MAG: hypothetical protein ACYTAF_12320, partial [Planctomycetota bacterium]